MARYDWFGRRIDAFGGFGVPRWGPPIGDPERGGGVPDATKAAPKKDWFYTQDEYRDKFADWSKGRFRGGGWYGPNGEFSRSIGGIQDYGIPEALFFDPNYGIGGPYGQGYASGQRGGVMGRSPEGQAFLDANKYKLKWRKEDNGKSKQFGKGKPVWKRKGAKGKGSKGGGKSGLNSGAVGGMAEFNV